MQGVLNVSSKLSPKGVTSSLSGGDVRPILKDGADFCHLGLQPDFLHEKDGSHIKESLVRPNQLLLSKTPSEKDAIARVNLELLLAILSRPAATW